uniref:Transcription termination factor 4, mitochondrial n=1 Tax=Sphenodon punctatus TaxID=8508 RepID=A0A8D0HQQ7_SPHPU
MHRHSLVPIIRLHLRVTSQAAVFTYRLQHPWRQLAISSFSQWSGMSLSPCNSNQDSNEPEVTQKLLETLSSSFGTQQKPSEAWRVELGKVVDSLLGMEFSHGQITELFGLQPRLAPQPRLIVVSELLLLGLNADATLKILQKCPEMLRLTAKQLRDRKNYLRRLGLEEECLQQVVRLCPDIFSLPRKRIDSLVWLLKEKCLFTVEQVSKILQSCPSILLKEPYNLEYKFQYAYFKMGIKHQKIVKPGLFQTPLAEIKNRHTFLERMGLYQTPDKKGQTQIVNPKLKDIIRISERDFLAKMACSTNQEYEVFKKLYSREEEEQAMTSEDEDSDGEGPEN